MFLADDNNFDPCRGPAAELKARAAGIAVLVRGPAEWLELAEKSLQKLKEKILLYAGSREQLILKDLSFLRAREIRDNAELRRMILDGAGPFRAALLEFFLAAGVDVEELRRRISGHILQMEFANEFRKHGGRICFNFTELSKYREGLGWRAMQLGYLLTALEMLGEQEEGIGDAS